jgi:hypothetical protein
VFYLKQQQLSTSQLKANEFHSYTGPGVEDAAFKTSTQFEWHHNFHHYVDEDYGRE